MSGKASLEEAVQQVLRAQAEHIVSATGDTMTVRGSRRRISPWAPLAAALAAVAVIVAATYATLDRTSTDHTARSKPATTTGAPAGGSDQPEAVQYVSFHGIEVAVPATWRLYAERCGTATTDTVLLAGVHTDCRPNISEAQLTVVRLATIDVEDPATLKVASSPEVVGEQHLLLGHRDLPDGRQQTVALFPSVNVVEEIASPRTSVARSILDSTRAVSVDHAGCASRRGATSLGDHHGLREAVSTPTVRMAVCSYVDGWLYASSARPSSSASTALTQILSGLPAGYTSAPGFTEGSPGCEAQANSTDGYLIRLWLSNGQNVALDVRLSMCGPMYVTDGSKRSEITKELLELLPTIAPYDANLPPFDQLVQHPA